MSHCWINRKPFGVTSVLVSGQPAENRLPHERHHRVLRVLSRAPILEHVFGHRRQFHCLIKFPVCKQSRVGGNPGTVKLQLQTGIKFNPQCLFVTFTP